ncbi:hypothetical protein RFI_23471 [Reticulomyxa filosa]|uniref:Protein kinase domain-containing protein n=1 Tax=Reticulomyxa filosa TaxID=46433 RepID=X6MKE3_RETFI|nr:hypothetical protein RFI_23471 [Reticulomyxa filosa]|eukprot:ETO13897.1 hypothetical protein RFI_23471 [Reticulomyxa filosa]
MAEAKSFLTLKKFLVVFNFTSKMVDAIEKSKKNDLWRLVDELINEGYLKESVTKGEIPVHSSIAWSFLYHGEPCSIEQIRKYLQCYVFKNELKFGHIEKLLYAWKGQEGKLLNHIENKGLVSGDCPLPQLIPFSAQYKIESKLTPAQIHGQYMELKILRQCNHPTIVRIEDSFDKREDMSYVMEYSDCGTLQDAIVIHHATLKEKALSALLCQVLHGVDYLHKRGVIHRDIKPDNILLDSQMRVKICDFTTVVQMQWLSQQSQDHGDEMRGGEWSKVTGFVGTPAYAAPEMYLAIPYDHSIDMWSVGCTLFFMLTAKHLFHWDLQCDFSRTQLAQDIVHFNAGVYVYSHNVMTFPYYLRISTFVIHLDLHFYIHRPSIGSPLESPCFDCASSFHCLSYFFIKQTNKQTNAKETKLLSAHSSNDPKEHASSMCSMATNADMDVPFKDEDDAIAGISGWLDRVASPSLSPQRDLFAYADIEEPEEFCEDMETMVDDLLHEPEKHTKESPFTTGDTHEFGLNFASKILVETLKQKKLVQMLKQIEKQNQDLVFEDERSISKESSHILNLPMIFDSPLLNSEKRALISGILTLAGVHIFCTCLFFFYLCFLSVFLLCVVFGRVCLTHFASVGSLLSGLLQAINTVQIFFSFKFFSKKKKIVSHWKMEQASLSPDTKPSTHSEADSLVEDKSGDEEEEQYVRIPSPDTSLSVREKSDEVMRIDKWKLDLQNTQSGVRKMLFNMVGLFYYPLFIVLEDGVTTSDYNTLALPLHHRERVQPDKRIFEPCMIIISSRNSVKGDVKSLSLYQAKNGILEVLSLSKMQDPTTDTQKSEPRRGVQFFFLKIAV